MTAAQNSIASAKDYFDVILAPDVATFIQAPSLRNAFHAAVSLFHMHEWVFVEHGANFPECKTTHDFCDYLSEKNKEFELVREIANASKHMVLRSGEIIKGASSIRSDFVGCFGDHALGEVPLGGETQVRILVGGHPENFFPIAARVEKMWRDMFEEYNW